MGKLGALNLSLSTKVLVPVLSVMVLMLAITAWTVNQRITRQFENEAARSLATADAVFRNSQKTHARNVLLRFRNLDKEPRYRAAFQSGDLPTLRAQIRDLPEDQGVDVALFSSTNGEVLAAAKRDLLLAPLAEFQEKSALATRRALGNEANADTIRAAEKLFDVVSIPVLGPDEAEVIGAITFGSEIGDADFAEFSALTQSKIVVLAGDQVIASTVPPEQQHPDFAELFRQCAVRGGLSKSTPAPREIQLGDEHYFCSAGSFTSLSDSNNLGYLLLCSYEQPLRALHTTQQILLLVCGLCILAGTGLVWFLVGKLTEPLRALRDSAEAVGRGDFSQRVEVASGDECGELGEVFNRMTGNLKQSREQLEQTVERLKNTQAQLIQSEKLSGIGEFVAGVAHELNNPLTTVMGFSELLAQSSSDPQHRRHLDMILKSAQRCQKIVQNLLSFARRHQPERKLSSVNELVTGAVEFLQYQLRTGNIEVVTKLAPDLPKVMLDRHQMQQVFLNIINNARQAIEGQRPNGRICITTESCGNNVRIEFQDNGPGIPEANLSKVFDPFFTTKEVGKGTGLGLSLCYGIVKEHHGSITVRSRPAQGATFIIELPLASGEARGEEPPGPTAAAAPGGGEGAGKRVLVIDDEDTILEMVREMLVMRGYQVDVARDGESALSRVAQSLYDLALCDWKMPGLSGRQVYERLRVSNPVLAERMIFVTGDVVSDTTQAFLQERKKVCLSKPFSLDEFRAAVNRALAA